MKRNSVSWGANSTQTFSTRSTPNALKAPSSAPDPTYMAEQLAAVMKGMGGAGLLRGAPLGSDLSTSMPMPTMPMPTPTHTRNAEAEAEALQQMSLEEVKRSESRSNGLRMRVLIHRLVALVHHL